MKDAEVAEAVGVLQKWGEPLSGFVRSFVCAGCGRPREWAALSVRSEFDSKVVGGFAYFRVVRPVCEDCAPPGEAAG